MANEQVVEGGTFGFIVVAKNKFGTTLPITDATVAVDAPVGSATINSDGSNGVFTAGTGAAGSCNLVAKVAGVESAPFGIDVVADTAVASVEIQPAAPAVVSVAPAPAPAPVGSVSPI